MLRLLLPCSLVLCAFSTFFLIFLSFAHTQQHRTHSSHKITKPVFHLTRSKQRILLKRSTKRSQSWQNIFYFHGKWFAYSILQFNRFFWSDRTEVNFCDFTSSSGWNQNFWKLTFVHRSSKCHTKEWRNRLAVSRFIAWNWPYARYEQMLQEKPIRFNG